MYRASSAVRHSVRGCAYCIAAPRSTQFAVCCKSRKTTYGTSEMNPDSQSERLEHEHSPEAIAQRLHSNVEHQGLGDFVLGAVDGTVTTFAIVAGVAGADLAVVEPSDSSAHGRTQGHRGPVPRDDSRRAGQDSCTVRKRAL